MESHILDISHVIQLSVAPVFLLTAIATMINAMSGRLGRIIDRRRLIQDRFQKADESHADQLRLDLEMLIRRSRMIYLGILFSVLAALFICLVVAGAFVGALVEVELSKLVAVVFILAMSSMIVSLGLFLREVYLGVSSGVSFVVEAKPYDR